MKKVILISFFFAVLINTASFANKIVSESPIASKQAYGKYVYFRVYVSSEETYYFSNVIWVEGETTTEYFKKLAAQKERFKEALSDDFDVDWTAPVPNYSDNDKSRMVEDRKTRIEQAGENWENIDL